MHLNTLKKEHATQHDQRAAQIQEAKAKINDLVKAGASRKEKQKEIEVQMEKCKSELDSYEAFRQAQEEHKLGKAERQKQREEMTARLEQIETQMVLSNEQKNASIERLARAQRAKEASNEVKDANDHIERTSILPGKEEMIRLAEAKQALAVKIGEYHKTSEQDRAREKHDLDDAEDRRKSLNDQVERLVSELNTMEEEKAALESGQADFRNKRLEQIASHKALEKSYRETFKSTERNAQTTYEACRSKMEQDLQDFVSGAELEWDGKKKLNEILEIGIEMLQSTIDAENRAVTIE
jgi:chromosome segregation ATPase